MNEPVYFRDLADCEPIEPLRMSGKEKRQFIEKFHAEMERGGFSRANEITKSSKRLTAEDYRTYINH